MTVSCSGLTSDTTGSPGKLRSHGLRAPTGDDLRQALRVGTTEPVELTWEAACERAGLDHPLDDPSLDELEQLTEALRGIGGPAGLVGRAMGVRLATYRSIRARGGDAPPPAWDWARSAMDTLLQTRTPGPAVIEEILSLDPFADTVRVELDQAAARVAQRLGTALGGVSVVLGGALCLVGAYGGRGTWIAEARGNPLEWSFCATSVRTREPYVVPDVQDDVIHRHNPTTVHDGVRSYAGAPLLTSRGEVLGSCCVIDVVPRAFTAEDVAVLQEEAAAIVAELERRREARAAGQATAG